MIEAARATVQQAWQKEVQPVSESALIGIKIHAVEKRNRLAPGVYLVQALAETAWWKHSVHYLLLMRAATTVPPDSFEVLYRFAGGSGGKGIEYRLVDLGSETRRPALEISDHGVGDDDASGTLTILVLHLPESDRFAEVFRELTTYRPPSPHGYVSKFSFRSAASSMKELAVSTELLKDGQTVDHVESVFVWQESAYEGTMPLPEAWRAELPTVIERPAPAPESADQPAKSAENPP